MAHWNTTNTQLEHWQERDRLHISLESGDATIAEWWDDEARSMFEDGYFKHDNLHQSVVDYANEHDLGRLLYV